MADSEEQLLSELLGDVGSSDRILDARDLEPRVLAAWDVARQGPAPRPSYRVRYVIAGVAAGVLVAVGLRTSQSAGIGPLPTVQPVMLRLASVNTPVDYPAEALVTPSLVPNPQSPVPKQPIVQSPIEFVSLMPMTERELSGSFQIVRVQMPRASLGALTSPLDRPSELVEADVLLGEDGMARAIRVSTNGSVYPWRSR